MKFGVMFRPQDPPRAANLTRRWDEILEAACVAEDAGFAGVFLPEHHMREDGYPPSPWAALGALAARTKRIDLGTAVHLLPLRHPLHTAEDAAMVDVISGGRLRLGVGIGNYAPEFELYGWDKRQQVSRFEEAIDLVLRAWSGETLDHQGRHFVARGPIRPVPTGAQLWIGATTAPGVRRAARFGRPWITGPLQKLELLKDLIELYRTTGEQEGTSAGLRTILLRDGLVGDSLADVEKRWWPLCQREHWSYFSEYPRFTGERSGPTFAGVTRAEELDFDSHRTDRLIVGSPADCIEQIQRYIDVLGIDYLVMTFRFAAGPSHKDELNAIRRFAADVMPAFSGD
jgi:alkanesulfonate monooxygenase SsuD/methylene tetrahydromethanopterin reductase-like flavin-dependent oxidoreductase (luciferase family)